jgi:hypothetical protein
MILPTRSIFDSGTPSRARCSSASGDGVQKTSQIASVTRRLISSGMRRSPLRSPASRCTTGIQSLVPTWAQAAVELTSPTTTIQSGFSRSAIFSYAIITPPVCSACVPLPTSRWKCGLGSPRSRKNASDMFAS